jgi:hypothetical protein
MRVPVVKVTLYLPGGFGTRYPAAVLASKRREVQRIDCISAKRRYAAAEVMWALECEKQEITGEERLNNQ